MKLSFYTSLPAAFLLAGCMSLFQGDTKKDAKDAQVIQAAEDLKQSGNMAGAVAVLRQAQTARPEDPLILAPLGNMLIADNQPKDAAAVFGQLITLQPGNADAYSGKAIALDRTGDHMAAQELYGQALALSPDSLSIRNNLAMSMILNDQLDQAIALLEKLNSQPGAGQTVRQNLALAYGIKGDKKRALELNLQDLPEDKAQENMRFYEQYVSEHKKPAAQPDKHPDKKKKKTAAHRSHDQKPAAPETGAAVPPTSLDDILSSETPKTPAPAPVPQIIVPEAAPAPVKLIPNDDKSENNDVTIPPVPPSAQLAPAPEAAPVSPAESSQPAAVLPVAAAADETPEAPAAELFPFHFTMTPAIDYTYPSAGKRSATVLSTSASAAAVAVPEEISPPAPAVAETPAATESIPLRVTLTPDSDAVTPSDAATSTTPAPAVAETPAATGLFPFHFTLTSPDTDYSYPSAGAPSATVLPTTAAIYSTPASRRGTLPLIPAAAETPAASLPDKPADALQDLAPVAAAPEVPKAQIQNNPDDNAAGDTGIFSFPLKLDTGAALPSQDKQ